MSNATGPMPRPNRSRAAGSAAHAALVAVAAVFLVLLSGCGTAPPNRPPDLRGVITDVQTAASGDRLGGILVVWTDDAAVGAQGTYDAAQLTVSKETTLARGESVEGQLETVAFEDLRAGDIVEVWLTDGPVLESYPVQAGADFVLVKGAFSGELPSPPGLEAPVEPE